MHAIFYKHLTSWLLYGHLEDLHKEFFIQQSARNREGSPILFDSGTNENSGLSVKGASKKSKYDMLNFNVEIDMVPSYIRPSLASKILSIGQTVIMFSNDPRESKKGNIKLTSITEQ